MSLNIEVESDGLPLRRPNEYYILSRQHIEFEVKLDAHSNYTSPFMKGHLILTSHRLILFNEKPYNIDPKIVNFEIALARLVDARLE